MKSATSLQGVPISVPQQNFRPRVLGKFLGLGTDKFHVRGVTYGPFQPDRWGCEYHDEASVKRDFSTMVQYGINAVRTYTPPPHWLLDLAQQFGLLLLVGIPWEQHVTFLEDRRRARSIEGKIRKGVADLGRHPAILAYSIGNEIPAPIVRWYGRRRMEAFLRNLYTEAKQQDPEGLVTYVNYPTTEYLQLPFLDFLAFNVYLETQEALRSYLARLQNLADERPLVMTELGLDSRRNGLEAQATTLDWQIRTAFETGCAGGFVFAWTDEWHRGGLDVDDWDFGLTDRQRNPKPALDRVGEAFRNLPFPVAEDWPRISVVVCVYNGAKTIRKCLDGLVGLKYPNFEILVVDDGSLDDTASLVSGYNVRLISTPNGGLSRARNRGLAEAKGEIVAYIDADATPDPHWLTYLAYTFKHSGHAGVGVPNIHPKSDLIADCISRSPGNPCHVLLTDVEAEHIPGCNMAFRRSELEAVGGFDSRFRIAGDDVDVCWKIRQRGWTLGFNPAAMVWHEPRPTIYGYWKQQLNYGRAEAMLERKWPGKYSLFGHVAWRGRLYGPASAATNPLRWRVYHGVWGTRLFQHIYSPTPSTIRSLLLMPEWLLVITSFAGLAALGLFWSPLLLALGLVLLSAGAFVGNACLSAHRVLAQEADSSGVGATSLTLTSFLHILQAVARLLGRLHYNLKPWASRGKGGSLLPRPRSISHWSEEWKPLTGWLSSLEYNLQVRRVAVIRGGEFDRWDLKAWAGLLGGARLLSTVEEHGEGKQLLRIRLTPILNWKALWIVPVLIGTAVAAALDGVWVVFLPLALISLVLTIKPFLEAGATIKAVFNVVKDWE